MIGRIKTILPVTSLILLGGILMFPRNTTPITFNPQGLEISVFQGGTRSVEIKFKSDAGLSDVRVSIVPELRSFIQATPDSFPLISKGSENAITLFFKVPKEIAVGKIEGTLHLRTNDKTIAKPLPIIINILSPQVAEQGISDVLVEQFGTTTPQIPEGSRFLFIDITPEMESFLSEGSNLPAVFSLSSVTFSFNVPVDNSVGERMDDLLPLVRDEGIRIDNILNFMPSQRWHQEDPARPLIPGIAITFFPGITIYDLDGNGRADKVFVAISNTTHTVVRHSDAEDIIARRFRVPTGISSAALITLHELAHVLNFRTECGGGREWYLSQMEEDFVQDYLQPLIQDIFNIPVKDTTILNAAVDSIIFEFPNTQNCLERLDLTRPTPVNLETSVILE